MCLGLASCGGGGSGSGGGTGAGGTLSKSQLISQGDAICQRGSDKTDALGKTPSDAAGIKAYFDKLTGILNGTLADLRELKPPSDLAADYNSMLAVIESVISDSEKIGVAASAGDGAKMTQVATHLEKVVSQGGVLAKRIGFKGACAEG